MFHCRNPQAGAGGTTVVAAVADTTAVDAARARRLDMTLSAHFDCHPGTSLFAHQLLKPT